MNIEALRTLVNIARHGNYRRVAESMNMSQPAISKRIRMLEEHFGHSLVERAGSTMRLTSAGHALLPYMQRITDTFDEANRKLNEPEKWEGTIRVGAVDTIISTWITDFLDLHHQRYPNIKIDVVSAPTIDLLDDLRSGGVDIAIVLGPSWDRALVEVPLCVMEIAFFRARQEGELPALVPRPLGSRAISEANIITFPRGSRPYVDVLERLRSLGLTAMPNVSGCASLFTMRSMAERGLGVITLPSIMAQDSNLEALDLGIELPPLSFAAVYEPAAALPIFALTCALAAKAAADFARRTGSGISVLEAPIFP